jgi:hypothetical protein
MKRVLLVAALLIVSSPAPAQTAPADNPEMAEIVAADQAAREGGGTTDWAKVAAEDAERRTRTRRLLDQGALTTANDFDRAALVFQHGNEPSDFLLAHVLATRALALGRRESEWLAAATLDRYLQSVGEPQVYGTQFTLPPDARATQEPYDTSLLPDSVREAAGVHSLAEQRAQLPQMEAAMKRLNPPADP